MVAHLKKYNTVFFWQINLAENSSNSSEEVPPDFNKDLWDQHESSLVCLKSLTTDENLLMCFHFSFHMFEFVRARKGRIYEISSALLVFLSHDLVSIILFAQCELKRDMLIRNFEKMGGIMQNSLFSSGLSWI